MPSVIILTLPPPPSTSTDGETLLYYTPALRSPPQSLTSVNSSTSTSSPSLNTTTIIALPLPSTILHPGPRKSFDHLQRIVKTVYGLTSTELWGQRGQGVGVVFYGVGVGDGAVGGGEGDVGPVFALGKVVECGRRSGDGGVVWVTSEGTGTDGDAEIINWRKHFKDGDEVVDVPTIPIVPKSDSVDGAAAGGSITTTASTPSGTPAAAEEIPHTPHGGEGTYDVVAVGGTFDHLHAGHKLLLTGTLLLLSFPTPVATSPPLTNHRLIIGLTGPPLLLTKKHKSEVYTWPRRASDVLEFLSLITHLTPVLPTPPSPPQLDESASPIHIPLSPTITLEIALINDPYGPTITDESVQALVVSEETKEGGRLVNVERAGKGWAGLDVWVVGVVMEGGTGGEKMSSTERRRREEGGRGKL